MKPEIDIGSIVMILLTIILLILLVYGISKSASIDFGFFPYPSILKIGDFHVPLK